MEVLEIVIYIGISIIVGTLIINFLVNTKYDESYRDMKTMMIDNQVLEFEQVNKPDFAGRLHKFFEICVNTGQDSEIAWYIRDNGTLSKSELFSYYKEFGWCQTIQSSDNDCGVREDVVMGTLELPRIVRVNCSNSTVYLT